MKFNIDYKTYSEVIEKIFGRNGAYSSPITKQLMLILHDKGVDQDKTIKVVNSHTLTSLLKEKSPFKSDNAGLRKHIEVAKKYLRKYYLSLDGKKEKYQISIINRYGRGYLLVSIEKAHSLFYDYETSIYIKIFNNGQAYHKRVDHYQVLCDSLSARDHFFLQWKRGNVTTLLKNNFKLKRLCDIDGKNIADNHKVGYKTIREKEDEYYWKMTFDPPLAKGSIIKYENEHQFLRPYPMSMKEIIGEGKKMYEDIPYAYEGISANNEKEKIYLEIEFPKNYEINLYELFIESGFTGKELEMIKQEYEAMGEKYISQTMNENKLKMLIEAPIIGVTYSIKWKPPDDWPKS